MELGTGAVRRVYASETDREALSLTRIVRSAEIAGFDYSGVVVDKPWGYEYLMYQNAQVAVWILHLKLDSATSMHCHVKKKTSLVVLDGQVTTSTLDSRYSCAAMEGIILEPGVFHSTRAVSSGGAFVMEIESPPDKQDVVRLRDEYGRKGLGYEDTSQYSRALGNYPHVAFHKPFGKYAAQPLKGVTIAIHRLAGEAHSPHVTRPACLAEGDKLYDQLGLAPNDLVGSYGGLVVADSGSVVLASGDVCQGRDLMGADSPHAPGGLELVTIRKRIDLP